MADAKTVKLVSPNGGVANAPEKDLKAWLAKGWKKTDEKAKG